MRLSLIVTGMGKPGLTRRCIDSFEGQYDELIYEEIIDNWVKSVNRGIRAATGDYFFYVNNDTYLLEGNLKEIAFPGIVFPKITVPPEKDDTHKHEKWNGTAFGFSDKFQMDERYHIFYGESEYFWKFPGIKTYDTRVNIFHELGGTLPSGSKRNKLYERDQQKFIEKWGHDLDHSEI